MGIVKHYANIYFIIERNIMYTKIMHPFIDRDLGQEIINFLMDHFD